jgi:hypothetical protein
MRTLRDCQHESKTHAVLERGVRRLLCATRVDVNEPCWLKIAEPVYASLTEHEADGSELPEDRINRAVYGFARELEAYSVQARHGITPRDFWFASGNLDVEEKAPKLNNEGLCVYKPERIPFLALKDVEGEALSEALVPQRTKTMTWRERLGVLESCAGIVAKCHAVGLVHGDLKEDQFRPGLRPTVLIDWEYATFLHVPDLATASREELGMELDGGAQAKLEYARPERVKVGMEVRTRRGSKDLRIAPAEYVDDVYALAIIAVNLMSGNIWLADSANGYRDEYDVALGANAKARERLAVVRGLHESAPAEFRTLLDRLDAILEAGAPTAASSPAMQELHEMRTVADEIGRLAGAAALALELSGGESESADQAARPDPSQSTTLAHAQAQHQVTRRKVPWILGTAMAVAVLLAIALARWNDWPDSGKEAPQTATTPELGTGDTTPEPGTGDTTHTSDQQDRARAASTSADTQPRPLPGPSSPTSSSPQRPNALETPRLRSPQPAPLTPLPAKHDWTQGDAVLIGQGKALHIVPDTAHISRKSCEQLEPRFEVRTRDFTTSRRAICLPEARGGVAISLSAGIVRTLLPPFPDSIRTQCVSARLHSSEALSLNAAAPSRTFLLNLTVDGRFVGFAEDSSACPR